MLKKIIFLMFISVNSYAASWECINQNFVMCNTWRMSVPTGWIVASDNSATTSHHGYAMVFVPDQNHEWKI